MIHRRWNTTQNEFLCIYLQIQRAYSGARVSNASKKTEDGLPKIAQRLWHVVVQWFL